MKLADQRCRVKESVCQFLPYTIITDLTSYMFQVQKSMGTVNEEKPSKNVDCMNIYDLTIHLTSGKDGRVQPTIQLAARLAFLVCLHNADYNDLT